MAGLIRIDNERFSMSETLYVTEYVESYLIEAYVKAFFYTNREVPDFFDIIGLFEDSLEMSRKKFFTSEVLEFPMELHEISHEYVQEVLTRNKIEFISIDGHHLCDCQSVLFPEWSD